MSNPHPSDNDLDTRGADALRFVSTLWPETASGHVEFRFLGGPYPQQRWYRRDVEIPQFDWPWFLSRMDALDIFVGLALRREHGSGGRANCAEIWALVVDFDGKSAAAVENFERRLGGFPMLPTMVVKSGSPHARHAYWRLQEPIVFTGEGAADAALHYQRAIEGLAGFFGGDPAVSDVPRIIRLPGSRNGKPGNGRAVAGLVVCKPDRCYNLSDFDAWLAPPRLSKPVRSIPYGSQQGSDVDPLAEFARRGWVLSDQGSDMYHVACPWREQHTMTSGPSESLLWCWDGSWCYRCLHAHCYRRRVAQVYEFFRLQRIAERLAPTGDR